MPSFDTHRRKVLGRTNVTPKMTVHKSRLGYALMTEVTIKPAETAENLVWTMLLLLIPYDI